MNTIPARPHNGSLGQPHQTPASSREIRYQAEAANYIAAMIAELRQMSGKAGFEKLVGALDAAYYEAYTLLEPRAVEAAPLVEKTAAAMEPSPQ